MIPAAILVFLVIKYLRSDTHKVAQTSILAERAFKSRDYAGAERLFRENHQYAARMPERVRNRCEGEISIGWGHSLYRLGRLAEAEDLLRTGIPRLQATRAGAAHPLLAHAYMLWGDLCLDSGRYPEAETHYRKALEADESIGNLAMVAFDSQRLAHALMLQSRRDEAAVILERCSEIETRIVHEQLVHQGKDPGTLQITSMSLPDIHLCHQRWPEALPLYEEKVRHWGKSVTRPDNIDLGHLQLRLAACQAASDDRSAAIETCRRAVSTFEREWSPRHPKVAVAQTALAQLLAEEQYPQEAAEAARTAHLIFAEKQIADHPEALRLVPLLL